ncbi:glycosyltransferase [Cryobacterium sp. TMT1-21]|uniref:glycosyltransferase n=1 Tax=Cryobacterium sp. TMT1-21 TaxID=1259234 RepID=UPI001068EA64|nr:glycosyltransferase [Cryobacterium sp. TMT1-21]TFD17284.1 glycosyltransferase [Cryobacterium sp. TMT1-21]
MRIAHVITYVSSDGAFGGPVAVAVAQVTELARRGHEVDLLAGWDGAAKLEIEGVNVLLFRARKTLPGGFSRLTAPAMLQHMWANGGRYDATHVHLARDLVTLPVACLATRRAYRLVTQTHGMVMPDGRLKTRAFDALAMRATLRKADALLALTDEEKAGLTTITADGSRIHRITNGIDFSESSGRPRTTVPQIVFLARLHPRKRVLAFAEAARDLVARGTNATFHVVGPDEGDLDALLGFIESEGLKDSLKYEGAIPSGRASERLAKAAVYVLPSFGEIVPMTVLEAMTVGTPVVMTHDCGVADELRFRNAAAVTNGSPEELMSAIAAILDSSALAESMRQNAYIALREVFSIKAVVDHLEALYKG